MSGNDLSSVLERLTRVERTNRLLKRVLVLCFAATTALAAIAWKTEVDEQLLIKDRNGQVRFDMSVNPQNGLANGLLMVDANNKIRIDIGIDAQGRPAIRLFNPDGTLKRLID